ncbi:hypothetical protein Cgig2_021537 [Carnegiea gigantea]|uniref:Uncharacterized protein n=1 Tax=Carnegiea gigantea TaxID=171969 RepID=A0A9Q1KEM3_9CARY|nr:hypothetical protein Cgig2_021537 [Carnegiea gigantea]
MPRGMVDLGKANFCIFLAYGSEAEAALRAARMSDSRATSVLKTTLTMMISAPRCSGFAAEFGHGREERAKALMDVRYPNGRTVLHYAAGGGRTQICEYLIEQLKVDVDVKDDIGDTPLHTAALAEQYLTSAYLLDHGAQPNAANHKGIAPLHIAAMNGRQDQLRLLISKGAEVSAQPLCGTPLQCAAAMGMKNAVKILLDSDANVSKFSFSSDVHTTGASHCGKFRSLCKVIAQGSMMTDMAGTDPNLVSHGVTPLTVAVSEGQTKIIKCLLKAGADPNVTNFVKIAAMRGSRADVRALLQATTPIPSIADWSVDGILKYVQSVEAENQRKSIVEQKFHEAKAKGAEAVARNDYLEAIYWYTEASLAMTAKPKDAAVISNRSLCWARLNEGSNALKDAMACIILRPDWPKPYYRAGVAWRILQDYERAAEAFEMGLMMDPENKDLQDAKRDAETALRAARMSDFRGTFMHEYAIDSDDLCSMM